MTNYCKCEEPEVEEVDRGEFVCLKCELEVLRAEDAPEPDCDETTQEEDDFYSNVGNEWAQREALI